MKSMMAGLSVLAVCAGFLTSAQAANENLFQPACFWRPTTAGSSPIVTAAYAPPVVAYSVPIAAPPCATCQQPACSTCQQGGCSTCQQGGCSTKYVQQSYYQPVTSYQTQTYYEPVTTYQTSYYYEPVTTLRTSYYFDPNCCSYKQVATPETSYQLRSKSCPVQGYVARSQQVPVVTYQKAYYLQPQTTCCHTTIGGAIPMGPAPVAVPAPPPAPMLPPDIHERRDPGPSPAPNSSYYPPPPVNDKPATPPSKTAVPSTSWQAADPQLPPPVFPNSAPAAEPAPIVPAVRINRIVLGADASVEGQIVRGDNTPRPDVKVLFVNANDSTMRQTTQTNGNGRFQVTLPSGGWLVHIYNPDGVPVYHSRIDVSGEQNANQIVLVNR